ncbi:MAG: hypothetical protein ACREYA_17875 [Cupriavidus necator]
MEDRTQRFGIDPYRGQDLQLWQGTILRSTCETLPQKLVVSADCDLLSDKGAGEFFTLDIIAGRDFLREIVFSSNEDLEEILISAAREVASSRQSNFALVEARVLADWLGQGDKTRWSRDLPGAHPNDLDLLLSLQACIRDLTVGGRDAARPCCAQELFHCPNVQLKAKSAAINKKLAKAIESRLQSTRSDLYILPALQGDIEVEGYFVPFKSLGLLERRAVSINRLDLAQGAQTFRPVATCRPVLLHSLLQKLNLYFTRIGLTNSFKSEQETVVKTVLEKML